MSVFNLAGEWQVVFRGALCYSHQGMRPTPSRILGTVLCAGLFACGQPDPGAVHFRVSAPSDPALSPLADARVTSLEIRDARDTVLGRTRYPATDAGTMEVSLGPVPVGAARDLRLLALGPGGLQVLGLGVTREVAITFGQTPTVSFDLRRPLLFFGGRALSPGTIAPDFPELSPGRYLYAPLADATLLRVVDPNSGSPLLTDYHLRVDPTTAGGVTTSPPISAAVGTGDGKSLVLATTQGILHIVDSLQLKDAGSTTLPALPVQAMFVGPRDKQMAILHYAPGGAPAGGKITFVADLQKLRQSPSQNGLLSVDVDPASVAKYGPPLGAAFAPDGMVDVVLGKPLLGAAKTDCTTLGDGTSLLLRYDPKTGQPQSAGAPLPYTTAIVYTAGGVRVLAQPCATAGKRAGRVVLTRSGGDQVLAAPGTADLGLVDGGTTLVAPGRSDVADSTAGVAQGVIRVLPAGATDWTVVGSYELPYWQVPSIVTTSGGMPLPSSTNIVFAPRDLHIYRAAATPDRSRALLAARLLHSEKGMVQDVYLGSYTNGTIATFACLVDLDAFTYHLFLANLQTGAREQDWVVGMQMISCDSTLYDTHDGDSSVWTVVRKGCYADCRYSPTGKPTVEGYLPRFQAGYIPVATSALFGGQ